MASASPQDTPRNTAMILYCLFMTFSSPEPVSVAGLGWTAVTWRPIIGRPQDARQGRMWWDFNTQLNLAAEISNYRSSGRRSCLCWKSVFLVCWLVRNGRGKLRPLILTPRLQCMTKETVDEMFDFPLQVPLLILSKIWLLDLITFLFYLHT